MDEALNHHEVTPQTALARGEPAVSAPTRGLLISAAVLLSVLVWTCWTPMRTLVDRWWSDPDYTYGFLAPVFAGIILWIRRGMLASFTPRGSLWGLLLIAAAGLIRFVSVYYYFALVEPLSLLPLLAGIVLFVGGWRALRWAAPAIALLLFAVPLPGIVAGQLSHPLQRAGTITSTYVLQTLGFPATAQGNVISLTDSQMGIVEACSGLRMMMLFFAICFAAAFFVKRPALDRIIIVLSAPPIALLANIARIVLTGVLHEVASAKVADTLYHDLAGWFMMPLAVVLLWAEMAFLDRLLVAPNPVSQAAAVPVHLSGTVKSKRKSRRSMK